MFLECVFPDEMQIWTISLGQNGFSSPAGCGVDKMGLGFESCVKVVYDNLTRQRTVGFSRQIYANNRAPHTKSKTSKLVL